IYPTFHFRDARAAIAFLERAFGFERHQVHENDDGTIAHAELRFGDGLIMLGDSHDSDYAKLAPPPGTGSVYIAVDEIAALCDRARAAGAEIVYGPRDQDYGSRDFTARDPEGNLWSFGTYRPT
ncbi:MAG TPA: VOC family protein, partial [Solirubrobacteraceae bacterium]|nr:VOC family protein [Solirubrobacteraceae bacterium]